MDRAAHWQGVYETKAVTAVSWYQERPVLSLKLIAATGFPRSARIIDVGGDFTLREDVRAEHRTPGGSIQQFTYARFQRAVG